MATMWQDIKYGVRMLWKNPAFTLVAIIALALGIGANAAIFSVVNSVLLRTLPYPNAERLVSVYGVSSQSNSNSAPLSYPDMIDYREQANTLQYIAGYQQVGTILTNGGEEPERAFGADVSADLFPMLGVEPLLGRVFTREEDRPGGPAVVVISHSLWQRRFNSDPRIIGQEIRFGARAATVLGVMPPGFKFPLTAERSDFYLPLVSELARTNSTSLTTRDSRFLPVIASIKPGITLETATAEIDALARRLGEQYPATNTGNRARLVTLHEDIVGDIRPALLILLGAVGFVLLIACANVANLLLARAAARAKEIAVRTAMGASRGRVIRQLLTESLILALAGGGLGLLIAVWGVDALVAASPAEIPRLNEIGLDGRVLGFTFFISALTGIVFGLVPALQASKLDLADSLKEGSRGSTAGGRRNRIRAALVIAEVALSLVLLVGAGLLIKSFFHLLNTDPGYDTARVLSVTLPLSRSRYPQPEQQISLIERVIERIASLPGVEAVGATTLLPLGERDLVNTFNIEGRPAPPPGQRPTARNQNVTGDYFRAMNIPVRRGRAFTDTDTTTAPPVIIINEALANRYFPNEDPVGRHIVIDDEDNTPLPPREIVGIVGNLRHEGLDDDEPTPGYFVPFTQAPDRQVYLTVRSIAGTDPAMLAPAVRNAIKEVDREQLIWEARTMQERVAQSIAPRRFQMFLLGVFASVALVLAGVGIFGVMNYAVSQRTHEIGIRLALGAQKRDVLRLVVGQGMMLAASGVTIGLVGAFALTRVMASLLYGVSATDPLVFGGVALLLIIVAALACYIPARRAMRVDPMIALRYE
jgi:putative ABC transport system permease protein